MNFREFIKSQPLLEGGNVVIDGVPAQSIVLAEIDRKKFTSDVMASLKVFSDEYRSVYGLPIWTDELLNSRRFMSGSALTFFDQSIDDHEFASVKPLVGDIDLQVDETYKDNVAAFIKRNEGRTFGKAKIIGSKDIPGDTLVCLWEFPDYKIIVQLDFEFVVFDVNGKPTDWSIFSRSSAWSDMQVGIKGAAHKLLLRALNYPRAITFIRKAKTARSKDKTMTDHLTTFSVNKGVRAKYRPNLDERGNHIHENGLPTYYELTTKESVYEQNLENIFFIYFEKMPTRQELTQFGSFTGLIDLVKKYYPRNQWKSLIDGFVERLFGRGAQLLYRGDPTRDWKEKKTMLLFITEGLGVATIDNYWDTIDEFYKRVG